MFQSLQTFKYQTVQHLASQISNENDKIVKQKLSLVSYFFSFKEIISLPLPK